MPEASLPVGRTHCRFSANSSPGLARTMCFKPRVPAYRTAERARRVLVHELGCNRCVSRRTGGRAEGRACCAGCCLRRWRGRRSRRTTRPSFRRRPISAHAPQSCSPCEACRRRESVGARVRGERMLLPKTREMAPKLSMALRFAGRPPRGNLPTTVSGLFRPRWTRARVAVANRPKDDSFHQRPASQVDEKAPTSMTCPSAREAHVARARRRQRESSPAQVPVVGGLARALRLTMAPILLGRPRCSPRRMGPEGRGRHT